MDENERVNVMDEMRLYDSVKQVKGVDIIVWLDLRAGWPLLSVNLSSHVIRA